MVTRLILLFGSIALMFAAVLMQWNLAIFLPIAILGFVMIPFSTVLSGMNLSQFRILGGINLGDIFKLLINHNQFKNIAGDANNYAELEQLKVGAGAIYHSKILPLKAELEAIRHDKIDEFSKRLFLSSLASVFIIVGFVFLGLHMKDAQISLISLIVLSIIFWWAFAPARDYKLLIKNKVFSQFIKFIDAESTYNPEGHSIASKVSNSEILPNYDDIRNEDNIQFTHENVRIEVEELVLKRDEGSGKNRRKVTVFTGLIVVAEMNKNFNGKTIVKADAGGVGNWLSDKFSDKETIHLEDPQFEKMFQVYATDQIEARYLLTTAFMERIQKLRDYFVEVAGNGKGNFQFSFYEQKLVIMIPCRKDMFEPNPLTKEAIQLSEIADFLKEMQHIFAVIDQLKLNMKIGL